MACMENVCKNRKCTFQQFSNEKIKVCPVCGGEVSNFFDEELDHESPRGDDYEEINIFE